MDCYIWSSSNQWEGFTSPSGSFLHSVKVPGWGIWYYSQDLSTPVLLDETTGNGGTGFPTQWSNQRNISSSCVVQISATQTATIGDVRFHFLRPCFFFYCCCLLLSILELSHCWSLFWGASYLSIQSHGFKLFIFYCIARQQISKI